MNRFRTLGLGIALLLTMLIANGALAPRVTDAAPPAQLPQKLCATLLPPGAQINRDGSTQCDAWYGLADIQFDISAGCHSMGVLAATCDHDAMVAEGKRSLQAYQCGAPSMKNQGLCSSSDLGDAGYQYDHSYKHGDGTQVYSYGIYFQRSCYFVSAILSEQNQAAAQSLKNQMLTYARQVDAKIKTMPRCGPAQQSSAPTRLVVGIGGKYDESKDIVDVTAGVENRPNVGIGDDTYEWTLDGKVVKRGTELKTIQLSTADLAAGKHEIVVKITDNVNKITGGATYTFEKKKAGPPPVQPPAQPPAAKPPASASGTISIQTSSGTKTVKPGDAKTQGQVSRGDKASLRATCENLMSLMALFAFAEDGETLTGEMFGMNAAAIAIAVKKLNCLELLSQPKQIAMANAPAALGLPILAMPDAAVQLEVELTQGPLRVEVPHDKVAIEVATATSIVTSVGKNNFDVLYTPKSGNTIIAARQGSVSIQPQNSRLSPVTLRAGQMVTVTQSIVSPVAAIPTSGDPVVGFAILGICGGASCLGVIALFGGIVMLTRRKPKPIAPPPPVAPRKPTDLPEQGASRKPTNLPK